MRILVTGGSGVMGSRLVAALAARGHQVRVMALPGDRFRGPVGAVDCEVREGDVSDPASVAGVCDGVETVYHLAAVILSPDRAAFDRVNRRGTAHVVAEAARAGVRHLVYVSSASVIYPRRTPYAESKLAAEAIVRGESSFAHTVVRPTLVYDEQGGAEFQRFLAYLRRFPVVPFVGSGRALKRPVFAGDVVDALVAMVANRMAHGATYNLSGGEAISIGALARLMLQHHGETRPFLHLPVALCRATAGALSLLMADPPLNEYTIAAMINDADLDPAATMRDLGWRPLGVREGFARCFGSLSAGDG